MASGLFNDASLALFARVVAPRPSANQTNGPTTNAGSKRRRADEDEEANVTVDNKSSSSPSASGQRSHQDEENTVFVGNLPISMDEKAVSRYFRECGDIASVRLRSIPVEGTKVDDPGNQDLVKKVCKEQGKIGKQKGSLNAYVVFKDSSSIAAALAMNNSVVDGRHIRVDSATPTLFDPSRTLFIGNLPFLADEEELRSFIADRLPDGDEEVEGVRIVRDQETLIGKGIAYVLLKSRDAVISGLAINKEKFKDKFDLRVSRYAAKKPSSSASSSKGKGSNNNGNKSRSSGNSSSNNKSPEQHANKRQRREKGDKDFALRRLNLKKVVTKKKVLEARGQIKKKSNNKDKKKGGGNKK